MGWDDWQAIYPLTAAAVASARAPVEARSTADLLTLVENHYLTSLAPPLRPYPPDVVYEKNEIHRRLDPIAIAWALRMLRHPDFDGRSTGAGVLRAFAADKRLPEDVLTPLYEELRWLLFRPIEEDSKELEACSTALEILLTLGTEPGLELVAAFLEAPGDKQDLVEELLLPTLERRAGRSLTTPSAIAFLRDTVAALR